MNEQVPVDAPAAHPLDGLHAWLDEHVSTEPWLALAIVVAALAVGFLVQWILTRVLLLASRTRTDLDERLAHALQAPIVQTVVLVGLYVAAGRLEMSEAAGRFTGRGLLTIGLLVWSRAAWRVTIVLLRYASERADTLPLIERRTYPLFSNLSVVAVLAVATYAFLVVWDIDATGWVASAGVLGLAFGFAAKDTLSNLFSGVFIVADAPYQLGDYIVLDDGQRGRVDHIGLRSTRILTRDDVQITIPNSVIANSKITNQSGGGATHMRVRVAVSIGYGADVDRARQILEEIGAAEPLLLEAPAPRVRFRRLGDSGLDFELLGWVSDPVERGRAVDGMNTAILRRFRAEGIEIPYPHRQVILRREEPVTDA